jgi:FtsH-binding integral membrane protein
MALYQSQPVVVEAGASAQQSFMTKVFGWMSLSLLISAALAYFVSVSPAAQDIIFGVPFLYIALILAELGLVIYLSARITKMSVSSARLSMIAYAALSGITLSTIFLAYTAGSIASTFVVAAGTFAVTAVYGYATKRDLTSWGSLLFMFLIGLVIAQVVNMFIGSSTLYWTTTVIGIGLFVGLTAYDAQKIKNMATGSYSVEEEQKGAIFGALMLYLDFVNLFLFLLRIFGRRK